MSSAKARPVTVPDEEIHWEQPAAPELSADDDDTLYMSHAQLRARIESAESQLAAVRNAVLVSGISEQRADDAGRLARAIRALLTPTMSPGAKEETL